MARFINRKEEIKYLKDWFKSEPNGMLFVYGPKSSGKTTLITNVLEALNTKYYAINYLDLRGVLLHNFQSFLNVFFQKSTSGKLRELIEGLTINTGFFTIGIEDDKLLQQNPFKLMEAQLEKAVKKGLKPVIVIDEIHLLNNIYINGERYLLDELFNFFVRLTKVKNLAHIILATSNSHFVEKIYKNARLKKTTNFYQINHFSKQTVEDWLRQDATYLSENDIDYIYKKLGGSVWEIKEMLKKVKFGLSVKEAVQFFLDSEYGQLADFLYFSQFTVETHAVLQKAFKDIAETGFLELKNYPNQLAQLIPLFVEQEIWFYEAGEQKITANSESIRWAIKKSLDN